MDRQKAYKILGVTEKSSQSEIKKARDRLALKYHPDSFDRRNSPAKTRKEAEARMKEINEAYDTLVNQKTNYDDSGIDEDAIWKMKTRIELVLKDNNVTKEEMDDETIKHYDEKLRNCKTKEDLENFTSEVIYFIQIYARTRNDGYFDNKGNPTGKWGQKSKPAPSTETRSNTSSTNSKKCPEFTCDYCKFKVESDDDRPKYTFVGRNEAFCSELCRTLWDNNDKWWKDWNEKKKKEAQEWEDYKRKQDQKWDDYFRNLRNDNYSSYSSYTYTPSSFSNSDSSSNISSWLKDYKEELKKQKSKSLNDNIKRYIRDIEHKLSLKSVSEEKLNKKLGISNWRKRINQCADAYEAMDRKFSLENIIGELSREYKCANCGVVKSNYYPWEKNGKKYCSIDCQDNKKSSKNSDIENLREEIIKLRNLISEMNTNLKDFLDIIIKWIERERIIKISLDSNDKLITVDKNQKVKTINFPSLEQKKIRDYFHSSGKKELSYNELLSMRSLNQKDLDYQRKEKFKALLFVGIIAIIVVWYLRRRKNRNNKV